MPTTDPTKVSADEADDTRARRIRKPRSWRHPDVRLELMFYWELLVGVLFLVAFHAFAISMWDFYQHSMAEADRMNPAGISMDEAKKIIKECDHLAKAVKHIKKAEMAAGLHGRRQFPPCARQEVPKAKQIVPSCTGYRFSYAMIDLSPLKDRELVRGDEYEEILSLQCCHPRSEGCPCGYERLPGEKRCFALVNIVNRWSDVAENRPNLCPNGGDLAGGNLSAEQIALIRTIAEPWTDIILDAVARYVEATAEDDVISLERNPNRVERVCIVCESAAWNGDEWWI
ncbi:hypothetical protein QR680_008893 [Steinernema hermaphroditum]|uniref:Uncharacterized protein n=1 Tax=Steinernema hermaphroditum TaxID=289476 RepID=A0AA39M8W9_9BILA|nr:hypothetical protein QR680_008893 [Steinernema hermaphroditum]